MKKNKRTIYPEDLQTVVLTTKQILMFLADLAMGIFEYGDKGKIYRRPVSDYWQQREIDKISFSKQLYKLKRGKFIRVYFERKTKYLELLPKGKKRIRNYLTNDLKIEIPKQWDEKWRMVIFDIPNYKKTARDILASRLKLLGFIRLQKSVFVFPYDCKKEIDYLRELYEIKPYVQYIVADRIETEINLLKHFYDSSVIRKYQKTT